MFVQDNEGQLWPVSEIERVETENKDRFRQDWAHLKDGRAIRLEAGEFQRLRRSGMQCFPAIPGQFVIHYLEDVAEKNDPIIRTPIVGWVDCPEMGIAPVTVDGINDGQTECLAVLHPGGQVSVPYDRTYETIDQFIEEKRKQG